MKVKDLIQVLTKLEQEREIHIFIHKNGRPLGDTKPIQSIDTDNVIDQSSPGNFIYTISVNLNFEYQVKEEMPIIPQTQNEYHSNEVVWWDNKFRGKKFNTLRGITMFD